MSGRRCRARQKGCLERQDGCLERREGCLEGQEGLSGRPGARLAVLQAVGSAWKAVWSAWRSENVGRSDVLEFPLQENPRAPRAPREPKSSERSEARSENIVIDIER